MLQDLGTDDVAGPSPKLFGGGVRLAEIEPVQFRPGQVLAGAPEAALALIGAGEGDLGKGFRQGRQQVAGPAPKVEDTGVRTHVAQKPLDQAPAQELSGVGPGRLGITVPVTVPPVFRVCSVGFAARHLQAADVVSSAPLRQAANVLSPNLCLKQVMLWGRKPARTSIGHRSRGS